MTKLRVDRDWNDKSSNLSPQLNFRLAAETDAGG